MLLFLYIKGLYWFKVKILTYKGGGKNKSCIVGTNGGTNAKNKFCDVED